MWADRKTANEDEGHQTERYRDREKGKRMRLQYEEEACVLRWQRNITS